MALKSIFTSVFFFLCIGLSFSQERADAVIYDEQTDYIQAFPNHITARLYFVNTSNSFVFKDRNSPDVFKLNPNKQDHIGASVSFKFLTISYGFAPNFLAENRDNEGSKLFNINFRTYFGKFMQTLDIYNQKGFYLDGYGERSYLSDTKTFKIGGRTSYIFNENFSFRAIVSQDEKQLKNAGSFIPNLSYYYTKHKIVTDDDEGTYNSFDISVAPAYYYNFVPADNLLISAGASAGLGINHTTSSEESLTSLSTELNFRASIAYDISNFYLGSHYNYTIINHDSDRSTYVKDNIPYFEVFLGYRFKAPIKWVNEIDTIENKIIKQK
ncbi:DUF4421 family protein [Gelidibacter mesophilus]|uniref:DUF4421 family protein n=1 Tax=Gelidibacter mesophilus TaxID=169050 RepID=UPI000424E010|nr:DUF4421 family protein [Gelidibacter mesophilus]